MVAVDLVSDRWRSHLNPRLQAVSYSVLPLGRQVLKLAVFLIAILTVLNAWGYNTNAILAGVGVGGIASRARRAEKDHRGFVWRRFRDQRSARFVGDVCAASGTAQAR